MATKQEVIDDVAKDLQQVLVEECDGQYARNALAGISSEEWDNICSWLKSRDKDKLFSFLGKRVMDTIKADAVAEANSILADDILTLQEYARVRRI